MLSPIIAEIVQDVARGVLGDPSIPKLPDGLVLLWPALSTQDGAQKSAKGPDPECLYAGSQYSADGVSVGAFPAWHDGKGVWCGPSYTNLLQNTAFVGAVSGTPGTAPTGWTFTLYGGVFYALGAYLTFSGVNARHFITQPINVAASSVYIVSIDADITGTMSVSTLFTGSYRFPSGTLQKFFIDGTEVTAATNVQEGLHRLETQYVVSTSGSAQIRLGLGCEAPITGTVIIYNPILTTLKNAPYVVSPVGATTTVASAAGTSGGNGLAWKMDTKVLAALGGKDGQPTKCTVAAVCTAGASSADTTTDTNILTGNDTIASLLYFASGGVIKSNDGTTAASVTVSGGWAAGQKFLIVIEYAGTTYRVGYCKAGAETMLYGDTVAGDGAFNPGTHIRAALTTTLPMHLAGLQVWDTAEVTDARIMKYFNEVQDVKYVPVEYGLSTVQYGTEEVTYGI